MAFFEDFKKFAVKGNVTDLAVGVVIGAAFGKIVTAFVADLIMPVVALIMPTGDWRNSGIVLSHAADPKDNVILKYGDFLGVSLDFLVVALVLFIVISKLVHRSEAAPVTKECTFCMETIPLNATRCRACTSELAAKA